MIPEQIRAAVTRGEVIWNELASYTDGKLPFVLFDPDDPEVLISAWHVEESGNETDDFIRGFCFADLLLRRAKIWRDHGKLGVDPYEIVEKVLVDIARKGNPGPIEVGFLRRISQLAIAASQH